MLSGAGLSRTAAAPKPLQHGRGLKAVACLAREEPLGTMERVGSLLAGLVPGRQSGSVARAEPAGN